MKFATLLDILIELLSKRRVTASYLSEKYSLSPRTVYRYVEILSKSVPLQVKRGRSGGVCLADHYKLPTGFLTEEEYGAITDALQKAYTNDHDERFLNALKKLDEKAREEERQSLFTAKTEDVVFLENFADLLPATAEKLRILEDCMQTLTMADVRYGGEVEKIEPHSLIFYGNGWGMYAFSHVKREFKFFHLGHIFSIVKSEEPFRKRPFELPAFPIPTKKLPVRLAISKEGLERVENWLGAENIKLKKGAYIADVLLIDDGQLPAKILSFGKDVKVITPLSLKNKVADLAREIAKSYV